MFFNVYFLYRKSRTFGPLTKNCPKLDKTKSIVSSFSVFVLYKSAVSTVQKSKYVWYFNFCQCMNVCIWTSISWYFNNIRPNCIFRAGKKFSATISVFFLKMAAEVSINNCAKWHKDWKFHWYILDISKLAGPKLTRFRVCLSSLQYTPLHD